ncbi:MAG TPA: hypothetical protein VFG50_12770 [Rhodothermales bacterium]|nr:hypothetical protein [Rhodothermales bacterium]
MRPRFYLLIFALLSIVAFPARAQDNRLLTTDDWAYTYIQRLQRRGLLLQLDPTALPYTTGAVRAALSTLKRRDLTDAERRWAALLEHAFSRRRPDRRELLVGGSLEAGLNATNNDRLDPLRYTDSSHAALQAGAIRFFPNVTGSFYFEKGPVVAQYGLRNDFFYDSDPDGLDAANRLYVRSQDAYVGYNSRFVSAYLGRFRNHWGVYGQAAVLISDNPLSYDQLSLRIGGRRLALYSILGELDSATEDGQFTGRMGDLPPDERSLGIRRFVAAHRLTWRPTRNFLLSFMESTLYSSPGAGFSLKYLNPLHNFAFEVDNTPKNDENNGFIAGLLWAYARPVTITGQLLIDDLDVMRQTGEPGSIGITGSITYAGVMPSIDAGLSVTAITARTYNTGQPEGKYLYMLRGLATQFSDYLLASVYADVYLDRALPGLTISPCLDLLWQGSQDIRNPFPPLDGPTAFILNDPVGRTIRPAVRLRYQRDPHWWVRLDSGFNFNSGEGARDRSVRPVALLTVGARLSFARPYRLNFR